MIKNVYIVVGMCLHFWACSSTWENDRSIQSIESDTTNVELLLNEMYVYETVQIDSGLDVSLYYDPDGHSHSPLYVHLEVNGTATDILRISEGFEGYGNKNLMEIRDSLTGQWVIWNNAFLNNELLTGVMDSSLSEQRNRMRIEKLLKFYIEKNFSDSFHVSTLSHLDNVVVMNNDFIVLMDGILVDHAFFVTVYNGSDLNSRINVIHLIRMFNENNEQTARPSN